MATATDTASSQAGASFGQSYGTMGYRTYVLTSLTLVYTLNFIDRILIGVVGRPIIDEFSLSNFEFGLLSGLGFAVFYTLLGIPIASFSERYNRVRIIAISICIWSIATVLCGFAMGFLSLLLARVAVGVGEAGCTPPANSILSDYYEPKSRSTALGIFAMGVMLGAVLAQLFGGYILKFFTWREAFIVIGAPGILIGILVWMTIKEPPRGYSDPPGTVKPEKATFKAAFAEIMTRRTFWIMAMGSSLITFAGYAYLSFQPLYIQYAFDLSASETAIRYMSLIAFIGALSPAFAGRLTQFLLKYTKHAPTLVPGVGLIVAAPFLALGFLVGTIELMLFVFMFAAIFQYSGLGAQFHITQSVVGVTSRATAVAILLFMINIIGYGGGPPIFGLVADLIADQHIAGGPATGLISASCSLTDGSLSEELARACQDAKAYGLRWTGVFASGLFVVGGSLFLLSGLTLEKDVRAVASGTA
ncbi:MAG: MFS transporter [Henriciella sp.]